MPPSSAPVAFQSFILVLTSVSCSSAITILIVVTRNTLARPSLNATGLWEDVAVDNKRLGRAIAEARKAAELTASAAAELTETLGIPIHRVALAKIESGERTPTIDELLVIAVAFHTSPATLLFGQDLVDGEVEILPNLRASAIAALQWFSGEVPLTSDTAGGRYRYANKNAQTGRRIEDARWRVKLTAADVRAADGDTRAAFAASFTAAIAALEILIQEARDDGLVIADDA